MAGVTTIERAISAAVRAHGCSEATITRQVVRPVHGDGGSGGEWFVLFVAGEVWGRRRTRSELLALAKRGPLYATHT